MRLEGHIGSSGDDIGTLNQFVDALRASKPFAEGVGTLNISKVRKAVGARGELTSIFFLDSEQAVSGASG